MRYAENPRLIAYCNAMHDRAQTVTIRNILGQHVPKMSKALLDLGRELGYDPYNFNCRLPLVGLWVKK